MDERGRYSRRVRGMLMLQAGLSQAEVARRMGVSTAAVCKWKKRLEQGEAPGSCLRRRGRTPRLTTTECWTLRQLLQQGTKASGRPTLDQIRRLITAKFAVEFSLAQVSRIAYGIGWSVQRGELMPPQPDKFHAGWQRTQLARLAGLARFAARGRDMAAPGGDSP